MSRNPQDAPLPAARFEPATTATVELTEIDGMEQGAILRFADVGRSGHPSEERELRTCYGEGAIRNRQRPAGLRQHAGGRDPGMGPDGLPRRRLRAPRRPLPGDCREVRRRHKLICVHDKLCKWDFPHTDAVKAVLHPFNFVNRDEQQPAPIPANDKTLHQMYFALPLV